MKRLVIGGVIALCVTAFIASQVIPTISLERLRPLLEEELSEALGLEVRLAADPRLQLGAGLVLAVDGVRVANLPGRPSPHLLEIDRLTLEPRILPLLRRKLVIDSLDLYGAALRIEPDAEGAWRLSPALDEIEEVESAEPNDPFVLAIHEIEIHGIDVFFDRFDEDDVTTLHLERFMARSRRLDGPISIEARGELEGSRFSLDAETGSLAEFIEPTEPFPLDLRASLRDGRLGAAGTLGHPRTLEGMALRIEIEIADLANGARVVGLDVPSLGAVEVSGLLVGRDGRQGIEDLLVKSRGEAPLELEFDGAIRDLRRLEGIDVRMRVFARDADLFRQFTKISLPDVPLEVDLELEDADGSLGLSGEGEVSRPGFFDLEVEGGFGDLRGLRDLDVRVGFETTTLDSIFDAFARDVSWRLPDLGPLEASGRFVLRDGALGLDEIEISLGQPEMLTANLVGSVGDVLGVAGVSLDARIQAASASQVAARFDRSIPEVGPLDVAFEVRDADGSLGIESATAQVGAGDRFELRLSGAFDDLLDFEEGTFEASLRARDLALVGEIFELDLPAVGPVTFSGEIQGSRTQFSSRGRVQLNKTIIQGELDTRRTPGGRPVTVVQIDAPMVHLPDLLADKRAQGLPARDSEAPRLDLAGWWAGSEALPLDRLHAFDASISINAERVTGYDALDLQDLEVLARVENGKLTLEKLGADYEGGRVSGRMSIDARPVVPELSLEMEAFNVDLTRLMSQFQESTEYAGYLDLSIRLDTQGSRAAEVRSNLDGSFGAMLREGTIVNEYSRALSFNILRVSIPSFSADDETQAPVQCLLALLPIEGGIARVDSLYLEGAKVTVIGEGEFDLARDELALRLTPRLHEPGLVSIAATVEVTGPIESPDIRPIRRSMITSALGAIYRNAMRPFAAVGRMTIGDRVGAEEVPDPCGVIARQRVAQMLTEEFEPIDLDTAIEKKRSEPSGD